jgi:MFS family permease
LDPEHDLKDTSRSSAYYGLGVLTAINLLNYTDRFILAGVMTSVQKEFSLNNVQGGQLTTVFILVYMCASPLSGFLGDRMPRRFLISGAVLVWSLATIGSGFATTFLLLLVARAFTGIGEAGYGVIAPAFISDLFRKERRSRILAYFYTAMPLGAAAGYVIGGAMSEKASWQMAFFVGGLPGIALGLFALYLPEPTRGAMDDEGHSGVIPFREGLHAIARNTRFWMVVAGLTLMTFSIGGLSTWMPKFLENERGYTKTNAGLALGATIVIGGFLGTMAGGFLGDRMDRRWAGGGVMFSGFGLLATVPFMMGTALAHTTPVLLGCLLMAQFCLFLNTGPLNAAIVNVVPTGLRAFAFGFSMLIMHLLGDALSPPVIGWIGDRSSLEAAILINAVPVACGGLILLPARRLFKGK